MGDLVNQDHALLVVQEEKVKSCQEHHLITKYTANKDKGSRIVIARLERYREAYTEDYERVSRALAKTKNNSAPGPDRVTYSLLNFIKGTRLGQALIHDIARRAKGDIAVPPEQRDREMVITPKCIKDRIHMKGWGR